jgi:hypothetical protein
MTILREIYNAFDPAPLPANSKLYVDCKAVRGGSDVLVELGNIIQMSNRPTCKLYTGHRGGGKSTELLRLKQDLENKGCTVIYFSLEDEDFNPEDVGLGYTDILLACTRHLLEGLKEVDKTPVLSWFRELKQSLEHILQIKISLEDPKIEFGKEIAKVTSGIKTQPTKRAEVRNLLNPRTEALVVALNAFIANAMLKLPQDKKRLVVIADGLEKLTLVTKDDGSTNHDEIFIDRAEQLKGLHCDVIYTVPISLVLSSRASDLLEIYGAINILPMIMTELPMIMTESCPNNPNTVGIEILMSIVGSRVESIPEAQGLSLEKDIFDTHETLKRLCLMSGGHVRNLMFLVQTAIIYNEKEGLPIQASDLAKAVQKLRQPYLISVNEEQWILLAKVHCSKQILNDSDHRSLLFKRCLLEYCENEDNSWYDVHPVLREVPQFRAALSKQLEEK